MKNQKGESFAGAIAILGLGGFLMYIGFGFGQAVERKEWQTETVKRGYAEWVIAIDGSTTFQWKEAAK